ncbi:MAG TPA: multiheme c-type cytochrome [Gammaproteobacteria bacterium]|jgi:hypothetical protein
MRAAAPTSAIWATLLCANAAAQTVDAPAAGVALFAASSECIACHSNLTSPAGEDVSIGYAWRASMMANAARDPYWQAGVRREILDHPQAQAAIEDKCSTCHMPMARFSAAATGGQGRVFESLADGLALDGVSCTVCHQVRSDNFGEHDSFDGGFRIDTLAPPQQRQIYGPHDVAFGHRELMRSAAQFVPTQADHLKESEFCATCHTLYTQALGDNGEVIGELAEQMPYQEWQHSDFRSTQSCQDCHMPELPQDTPISSVLGVPRPGFSQHAFRGANAFMLRMLNKYRAELGVTALPQELTAAAQQAREFLGSQSARISIGAMRVSGDTLEFAVSVENLAGHKLPTAYPSRRAWLHVTVSDARGGVIFESGAMRSDGSIVGNDNDDDAARFEPHHLEISDSSQVQIFEPIMVDQHGRVTTGLLSGVGYVKDNRLLPRGFDKATAAVDIAVHGDASADEDFAAPGDLIGYRIPLGEARTALEVRVELNYQSIGFRWAENLKVYDAAEPRRFVRYYSENAAFSAERLASAAATVQP